MLRVEHLLGAGSRGMAHSVTSTLGLDVARTAPTIAAPPSFWLPTQSSTSGAHVDWLFGVVLMAATVVSVSVIASILAFALRSRREAPVAAPSRPRSHHALARAVAWSAPSLVGALALFHWGFVGYLDLRVAPKDAIEITVSVEKSDWRFIYPGGLADPVLHVPVGAPVKLIVTSQDVIHNIYVPAFRTKIDAVPGLSTDLWFQATETGTFPVYCAEHCGATHASTPSSAVVHEPGGFEKWLEAREQESMRKDPVELGADLFRKHGCGTCHSIDGRPMVGPSLQRIFGREITFTDGSSVYVTENHLRESILQPQAKIMKGFAPAMPTLKGKLSETEMTGLIEYLKTLK